MTRLRTPWFPLLAALLLATALACPALAGSIGEIVAVSGQVDLLKGGQLPAETARIGTPVAVGDFVRTKSNARAEIRFSDGNLLKIGPRSRIAVNVYEPGAETRTIGLDRGKVEAVVVPPPDRATAAKPKRFEIHTPNAVAGVRGTDLVVNYDNSTTGVLVISLHGGDEVYAYSLFHPGTVYNLSERDKVLIRDRQFPAPPRQSTDSDLSALGPDLVLPDEGPPGGLAGLLALAELPTVAPFPPQLGGIEVGVVDLISSPTLVQTAYNLTVSMTANFFAPSNGAAPTFWNAGNVQGDWTPVGTGPAFDPTGTPIFLSGTGPNGQASVDFNVTNWNTATGQWNADISNGFGSTGTNVPFMFGGTASGGGANGSVTGGTFTGSASGSAQPEPIP